MTMKFIKSGSIPTVWEPNSCYFIANGDILINIYFTDETGQVVKRTPGIEDYVGSAVYFSGTQPSLDIPQKFWWNEATQTLNVKGSNRWNLVSSSTVLDRFDLKFQTTTGLLDLENCQAFILDNTTASAKTITLLGLPSGRAMTFSLQIQGNVGTVTLPSSVIWKNEVAPTLKNSLNSLFFYSNGTSIIGAMF